jgi:hypothetical protein
MQVSHGKSAPLRRIEPGDRVVFYSPTDVFRGKDKLQSFTAIGVVKEGAPYPGLVDTRAPAVPGGPPLQVLATDAPPKDAFVAVQYHERWFWIADADIQSKYTFGIIMLLFSIADTGVKGTAPVVTIPPTSKGRPRGLAQHILAPRAEMDGVKAT